MTTTPTPIPGSRRQNPFQNVPIPVPIEGWNLRAADIFRERPLADHLERNRAWLQARPRTSNQIEDALFPSFALGGMESREVRSLLNRALWDAGFTPSHEDANPTWTWTDGI
ncbi:hypothetical protein [Mesoterricola silvestris]|uniref:Uncharacterized protein n=1 Tax=Mesoterricola silvestris TaxID=2927979 RepID=A0AA48GSK6_9BACT|nr:hypothetical protein [Mesoterricola silvestris]BDU74905.1 hypothetical protein METEAL_40790 [Mesoterricola silvestris]